MPKFATHRIEIIVSREPVDQLFVDGVGQLDSFRESLKGTTYESELVGLLNFVQHFSNGGSPGKKVKYLKGKGGATEYEYISKHLRLYAIQQPDKKIILFGGVKHHPKSKELINAFRLIKDQYLEFIKSKK